MFLIIIITARYLAYTRFSQTNAFGRNAYTRPQDHRSRCRITPPRSAINPCVVCIARITCGTLPPRSAIGPCVACIAGPVGALVHPAFFALCTNFLARLCQNMLQIILCYVEIICYIKNASYSLLCFKALKKIRIKAGTSSEAFTQPHGDMFSYGQTTLS